MVKDYYAEGIEVSSVPVYVAVETTMKGGNSSAVLNTPGNCITNKNTPQFYWCLLDSRTKGQVYNIFIDRHKAGHMDFTWYSNSV